MAALFLLNNNRTPRAHRVKSFSDSSSDNKATYRLCAANLEILKREYHTFRRNLRQKCRFTVTSRMIETFLEYLSGKCYYCFLFSLNFCMNFILSLYVFSLIIFYVFRSTML